MGSINDTFSGNEQCSNDANSIPIAPVTLLPEQATGICSPDNPLQRNGNGVVPFSRRIDTQHPLTGGGDFTEDRTHAMPASTDTQDGYLTKEDHQLLGLRNDYRIISGFAVWSGVGLTYNITKCVYRMAGRTYTTQPTTVTLAPNSTNNRIDVIYLTTAQTVGVLTGIPQTNPVKPLVEFTTQIELTFIYLAMGATTPTGLDQVIIYDENVEWLTPVGTSVDYDYTVAPNTNLKCIRFTVGSLQALFAANTLVVVQNVEFLQFYLKVTVANATKLAVQFYGSTLPFTQKCLITGAHGYDPTLLNVYQRIIVPIADISTGFGTIQQLEIIGAASVAGEFSIDTISLFTKTGKNDDTSIPRMYRMTSASFFNLNSVRHPDVVGKNLAIFVQDINRYLEPSEWMQTVNGFRILLEGFDATLNTYSIFVTTNLIEA